MLPRTRSTQVCRWGVTYIFDLLETGLILVDSVEVRLRHLLQLVAHVLKPSVVGCVEIYPQHLREHTGGCGGGGGGGEAAQVRILEQDFSSVAKSALRQRLFPPTQHCIICAFVEAWQIMSTLPLHNP